MKESSDKTLESLIETITKSKLPYWAKTTMALSLAIKPLIETLLPLALATVILNFLARLLGLG
jgi:hypothetical protein